MKIWYYKNLWLLGNCGARPPLWKRSFFDCFGRFLGCIHLAVWWKFGLLKGPGRHRRSHPIDGKYSCRSKKNRFENCFDGMIRSLAFDWSHRSFQISLVSSEKKVRCIALLSQTLIVLQPGHYLLEFEGCSRSLSSSFYLGLWSFNSLDWNHYCPLGLRIVSCCNYCWTSSCLSLHSLLTSWFEP